MKRGRPKAYIEISYEELSDWVGKKTKIPVSKRWLEFLMGESEEEIPVDDPSLEPKNSSESKIEYTLTQL